MSLVDPSPRADRETLDLFPAMTVGFLGFLETGLVGFEIVHQDMVAHWDTCLGLGIVLADTVVETDRVGLCSWGSVLGMDLRTTDIVHYTCRRAWVDSSFLGDIALSLNLKAWDNFRKVADTWSPSQEAASCSRRVLMGVA